MVIEPLPPPPEWYCRFGTAKFRHRTAGDFLVDWARNRGCTRYISLVHREDESEQVLERIRAVALANDGGERRIESGGATYHFYGTTKTDPAQLASVRVDQRPVKHCSFGLVKNVAVHGNSVTTFQLGRSSRGRLFGLYCALSSWESPMAIAIDGAPAGGCRRVRYGFGHYKKRDQIFNAIREEMRYSFGPQDTSQSLMVEYFTLPRSICLQFMEHYREERFLAGDTAESLKRFVEHLLDRSQGFPVLSTSNG